jgi:hypothetical protein
LTPPNFSTQGGLTNEILTWYEAASGFKGTHLRKDEQQRNREFSLTMQDATDDLYPDDQDEIRDDAEKLARQIMPTMEGYEIRTVLVALGLILQHIGLQAHDA